ncbi:prolyl oligopeptidase family serine peptidase [Streptomyces sp. NPDC048516]|uniref:S9 family peptidase n=1 Tax=Streptomyces sp. NPDC048516 TaxID=3365565 RepID=UPI0037210CD5
MPRHFTLSPDGSRVLFVRTLSGTDPVGRLWQYEDGAERLLADPALLVGAGAGVVPEEERLRRERARERSVGVVSYATDSAARLVAFALSGALWAVRTDGGAPFSVPAAGPVVDPRPSPDGQHIAYVSRRCFHVVDLSGADRRLAAAEGPDVSYGLAEYVAAESMNRMRGYWWAPDSRHVLVARVDTSLVERRYIGDPADPTKPPRAIPYPAAGTPNAEVTLRILSLEGAWVDVEWDHAAYEYLVDAGWDAHGPYLAVQSRDQRIVRTLSVDPATGATTVLHERTDPAWVELVDGTPARTASGALVLAEDDGDTRYLTVGGHRATPEGLQLCAVLGVEGERVLFTASEDPLETHVWSRDPDHGCRRLSRGPGRYTGVGRADTVVLAGVTPRGNEVGVLRGTGAAPGTGAGKVPGTGTGTEAATVPAPIPGTVTDTSTGTATGTGTGTETGTGTGTGTETGTGTGTGTETGTGTGTGTHNDASPQVIASLAEEPSVTPRPLHLLLGERQLRGALFLPSWHEEGAGKLPVLLDPYGGPGMQQVGRAREWPSCVSQWFAEQGFAVLVVDGRGTPNRGPAWEKAILGDQLTPALEDQVEALRAAGARFEDLDLTRVAIRGWSFGGFLAAAAVLHHPEVFHAAVAGAPPTDHRLYDTHWKERYLGHPEEHPENYERSSLAGHGHLLRRPLLLIHGLADDNVAAAHTLRFSTELLAAGKPHSVLPLPGATHMPADDTVNAQLLHFQRDFLLDALAARVNGD